MATKPVGPAVDVAAIIAAVMATMEQKGAPATATAKPKVAAKVAAVAKAKNPGSGAALWNSLGETGVEYGETKRNSRATKTAFMADGYIVTVMGPKAG